MKRRKKTGEYCETLKSINDRAMEMPKERIAYSFAKSMILNAALATVLETYIGTENVIRLAENPGDDALVESLTGEIKQDAELWDEAVRKLDEEAAK